MDGRVDDWWPSAEEVAGAGPEVWFRILAGRPGAGVFEADDPIAGTWASAAARQRYDLGLHGPAGRRCPVDFAAFDRRRPRGQTAVYCSTSCRSLASRRDWRDSARWVRCPVDGVGHLDAAAATARPRPACPPLADALGRRAGPSACERGWARALARARMARHRAARRADRDLERATAELVQELAAWRPWGPSPAPSPLAPAADLPHIDPATGSPQLSRAAVVPAPEGEGQDGA